MKEKYLKVVDLKTREIVHKVKVDNDNQSYVEKVMRGMLRSMDTDNFFIDDSDFD